MSRSVNIPLLPVAERSTNNVGGAVNALKIGDATEDNVEADEGNDPVDAGAKDVNVGVTEDDVEADEGNDPVGAGAEDANVDAEEAGAETTSFVRN
jgi:hypothetical protein